MPDVLFVPVMSALPIRIQRLKPALSKHCLLMSKQLAMGLQCLHNHMVCTHTQE